MAPHRESLIWMLPLLSVKCPCSCWKSNLGRSQEEQQRMAQTSRTRSKVHPHVQHSTAFPLYCLLSSGQKNSPASVGRRWVSHAGLAAGTLLPFINNGLWRTCSLFWPFCCLFYSTGVLAGAIPGPWPRGSEEMPVEQHTMSCASCVCAYGLVLADARSVP